MTRPSQKDAMAELIEAALSELPIRWEGLCIDGRVYAHNPDFLQAVGDLFPAAERAEIARQARQNSARFESALVKACPEGAVVLTGDAFARRYRRKTHRTLVLYRPLLSRDAKAGLVVAQLEESERGKGVAIDHYVLMRRSAPGRWRPTTKDTSFPSR